jgi:WD40 repeat protein
MAGTTAGAGETGGIGGIAGTTAGAGGTSGTGGIAGTTAGAGGTSGTGGIAGTTAGTGGPGGTGGSTGGAGTSGPQLCGRFGWGTGTFAAIAPGGALFALANDVRLHLYDWSTRAEIPLAGATMGNRSMAFSGNGTLFAAGSHDGVRVWRTSDGALVSYTPAMTDAWALALSSDGSVIATGQTQMGAFPGGIAQVLTPHGLVPLPLGGAFVQGIGVSPDGATVVALLVNSNGSSVTSPNRYDLTAWNTADGSIAWTKMLGIGTSRAAQAVHVVYAGDGSKLAYGGFPSVSSSLVTAAGATVANFQGEPYAFSADGLGFAGYFDDGLIIWSAANAAVSVTKTYPMSSSLPAPIAVGFGSGYTIEAIGQQQPASPGNPDQFEQFVTGAGAAASIVGSVPALLASAGVFRGIALSPDGKLAISVFGTKAFLWDVPTGNLSLTFDASTAPVFSADGSLIAYGIAGGMTAIARTSAPATALATVTGGLVVFSPNGRMAATATGTMGMIWSLDSATIGQPLQTLWGNPATGHTVGITALAFSADSATVATAGADRLIKLWRVSDGGLIKDLAIPTTSTISSLLFTLDGTRIIGGAIYAWDIASGMTQMATLPADTQSPPIFSAGRDAVLVDVPDQIARFATADFAPLPPIALPGRWSVLRSSDDGRTIATTSSGALLLWCAQ